MVKRYDLGSVPYSEDGIVEDAVGDYVRFSDYEKIRKKLEACEKALALVDKRVKMRVYGGSKKWSWGLGTYLLHKVKGKKIKSET